LFKQQRRKNIKNKYGEDMKSIIIDLIRQFGIKVILSEIIKIVQAGSTAADRNLAEDLDKALQRYDRDSKV
jgi:hypothetical protein